MRSADQMLSDLGVDAPPGAVERRGRFRRQRGEGAGRGGTGGLLPLLLIVVVAVIAGSIVLSHKSSTPSFGFPPDPSRRFAWIGTTTGKQFTSQEFQQIATSYDVVVFSKFHGGWNTTVHEAAATELKKLNPNIDVYEYMSTKYWFDNNEWGVQPDPSFFLKDNTGKVVDRYSTDASGKQAKIGEYLDLANPAYRAWAVNLIKQWMRAAPYKGIAFDGADPIGDYQDGDIQKWDSLIGSNRITAYNNGIRSLLSAARQAVGPGHDTIYNGISPNDIRGPNRDLDLLNLSGGAMDERFCLGTGGAIKDVRADITIMQQHPDSTLLMKTNTGGTTSGTLARDSRFCLGSFLLGWQPGSTYFLFAPGYSESELTEEPKDQFAPVGQPTGQVQFHGDIGVRQFTTGYVVVNTGEQAQTVTIPKDYMDVSDGEHATLVKAGSTVTVGGINALLLVDPNLVKK